MAENFVNFQTTIDSSLYKEEDDKLVEAFSLLYNKLCKTV